MVASSRRWALMHELRESPEPSLDELVARMTPVDLLLVEGFKHHRHAKIEVHRPSLGKELLYLDDPWIVAVATDEPFAARGAAAAARRPGGGGGVHLGSSGPDDNGAS